MHILRILNNISKGHCLDYVHERDLEYIKVLYMWYCNIKHVTGSNYIFPKLVLQVTFAAVTTIIIMIMAKVKRST